MIARLPHPRRLLPAALAVALVAGACTQDDEAGPDTTDLRGEDIILTSALQPAASCDDLLDQLIESGLERVGPYGFGNGGYVGPMAATTDDMAFEEASGAIAASDSDAGSGGDGSFSGTNNQEQGVDEPDMVKTDGDRLVVAQGNTIQVIDVADSTIERTIDLGADIWADRIFLTGDRVLVMATGWTETSLRSDVDTFIYPGGTQTTRLIDIDITTGETLRTLEVEGWYLSARDVDGTARIVLSAQMGHFPFLFPSNEGATEAATEANKDLIRNSTIDQWLPTYRITDSSGEVVDQGRIAPCEQVHLPAEFSGFGTLAVLTLDLEGGLDLTDQLAVVSDGQTVYASTDQLAVATARYPEWNPETGEVIEDDDYSTAIHTFAIDGDQTTYLASGSVTGHVLNQYSMSEQDGFLRVATTAGSPWWGGEESSESFVTVLSQNGRALETVGQVGGLGKGERIFAVRFLGDVGYVVTFRQTDPLYTVDLSDPTNPTVMGELKIPGFSTYLHPIDDGLLLGVGQDATDEGRTIGAQASAFDVSDLTDPTRIATLDLGENSQSILDWDKLAFTWWAPSRTAFVPVSWWGWDETTGSDSSGAAMVAIRVDEDGTMTELGRLSHPSDSECWTEQYVEEDLPLPEPADDAGDVDESSDAEAGLVEAPAPAPDSSPALISEEYCSSWQPEVRRTVIIDERIYTVSDTGVGVASLDGFESIDWLPFER